MPKQENYLEIKEIFAVKRITIYFPKLKMLKFILILIWKTGQF